MEKGKSDPIPKEFKTLEEAGEFWDGHSGADYWGEMEEVALEVAIQDRRFVILLEDAVYQAVEELAERLGVQPDALVNQLLREELVHV
jgi:hypothetical protein